MSDFSQEIMELRYSWDKPDGTKESWEEIARRVTDNVVTNKEIREEIFEVIRDRKFIPGGRFLAQSGRNYHQTNNCFMLRAEDTREGWGELVNKATVMLMSGGGIGIDYSNLRPSGSELKRTGGVSSGPIPLINIINEIGRGVMSGGRRRSAIWAGLNWNHADIFEFIHLKDWSADVQELKKKDYNFPAIADMTNISVILDKEFFDAFENAENKLHEHAQDVYWKSIERMCTTGEPGFSINYENKNESLRNACTEIVSEDDCDVCCLGSINLANVSTSIELSRVTRLGQIFLLFGTEYSDIPYPKVDIIRKKNRRTGLGLMGIHEWLIKHGYKYEFNEELSNWLQIWKDVSNETAKEWSEKLLINEPIAKRSIAPNGTISIAGGKTTSGIEPIYSVAYQRRYLTPDGYKKQYVVDFVAEKLVEQGINPDTIEDAYSLSYDVERRIKFQSEVQKFVDNSISSTINLPEYGTPGNDNFKEFGLILYKYLPSLRGITVYPNNARSGQPLIPVDLNYALSNKDVVFEGNEDCPDGICGL